MVPSDEGVEHEERVSLYPLDPDEALRALLRVNPEDVPADAEGEADDSE